MVDEGTADPERKNKRPILYMPESYNAAIKETIVEVIKKQRSDLARQAIDELLKDNNVLSEIELGDGDGEGKV